MPASAAGRNIATLPQAVADRIAAGEVVERPAAVAKELIENSLDAGADRITIVVKDAGRTLIRVVDNGSGMTSAELTTAIGRHATSKLRRIEDLETLTTFGFRGEALPSIAAVSRLEIVSRSHNDDVGTLLKVAGGHVEKCDPTAAQPGSSVSVSHLFYNVPARRKFLRSDTTEFKWIATTFRRFAIAFPDVAWEFYRDDELIYQLPSCEPRERMAGLLGDDVAEDLVEIDYERGWLKVSGFISPPSLTQRHNFDQFLFLNRRPITSARLNRAVYNACEPHLVAGGHPIYCVQLQASPDRFDINVHPAKTEVRFQREYEVFSFVKRAVRRALGIESVINFQPRRSSYPHTVSHFPGRQIPITVDQYGALFEKPADFQTAGNTVSMPLNTNDIADTAPEDHYIPRVLFQLHNKYIVAQIKSGLALIDQHAAHERILFEKALNALAAGKANSQGLLIPLQLEISAGEEDLLEELLPHLLKMGFEIKPFGPRTYLIEAVPAGIKISDEQQLVQEMLDFYKETDGKWVDTAEKAAAAFACNAAIKTGHELSPDEMVTLIEALFRTGTPFACPHGRPTYIRMELSELDRRFGRTS